MCVGVCVWVCAHVCVCVCGGGGGGGFERTETVRTGKRYVIKVAVILVMANTEVTSITEKQVCLIWPVSPVSPHAVSSLSSRSVNICYY